MPAKPSRMSELFVQDEQGLARTALDYCDVSVRDMHNFLSPVRHWYCRPLLSSSIDGDRCCGAPATRGRRSRISKSGGTVSSALQRLAGCGKKNSGARSF